MDSDFWNLFSGTYFLEFTLEFFSFWNVWNSIFCDIFTFLCEIRAVYMYLLSRAEVTR